MGSVGQLTQNLIDLCHTCLNEHLQESKNTILHSQTKLKSKSTEEKFWENFFSVVLKVLTRLFQDLLQVDKS